MKQRMIAWLLVLCSAVALAVPQVMAEEKPVTRIEWVQQLVETFDMTVEEDNYPDNYYSDMEESTTGYRDLLVAVEFGVIDLEAGSAFEPDQPATREFAAHTLNYCLGFQLDEGAAYTYVESAEASYPDDLQVAVNRGWFVLQDGKVLPEQTLTSTEASAMLKDAAAVAAGDKIDVGHNNSFTYESGVVEIPESTPVEINGDGTITVVNLPAAVKAGTTFVIYQDGFPKGYKAVSIRENGQTSVLTVEKVALDSILISADAEGRVQGDLVDFEPADGVDIAYIFSDGSETTERTQAARATKQIKDIVLNKTISGVAVSVTLSELSLDYGLSGGPTTSVSARVILNGEAAISSTIPFSAPASIELGYIPVGFFGSITITADIGVDGTITLSYSCGFRMGVSYSSTDGFRAITNFSKESFSLAANFNVHAGLKVAANITNLEFIYGTIYAKIGAQCNYTVVSHSEPEYPDLCVGTDAWLYANVGLNVGVSCWKINESYSRQIDIWSRRNSPIRTVSHFEDNVQVPACTCDTTGVFGRYFTPINSRYYNDGRRDVVNMPTYTYTVDDDGNATITGYSGSVSALSIPETIDGHTVVAIGDGAFKGNTRLTAVMIPNGVTRIEQSAFQSCSNLTNVSLSQTVKYLGGYAFGYCSNLYAINIPKSLQAAGEMTSHTEGFYVPYGGPFALCSALRKVTIEDGITGIPDYLFFKCTGLEEIHIPDTVTKIGQSAFQQCTNLQQVYLSQNVEYIGGFAFSYCNKIQSIKIPKSLLRVGESTSNFDKLYIPYGGPFAYCEGLQSVEIEDGLTAVPEYLFFKCTGIENVSIPDTVTRIGQSAFQQCVNLEEVKLSSNVTYIGGFAFGYCNKLTTINIPRSLTEVGDTTSNFDKLYIPYGGPFAYCSAMETAVIQDGIEKIPDNLFYRCTGIKNVKIPASVYSIGKYAFCQCISLENIQIPENVTAICAYAFSGTPIQSITIPNTVTSMGGAVFKNCTSLTDVTLPSSRENIMASTFEGCTALEKVVLPESVKNIRASAFKNCTALKELVWSKAPELIESDAFYNCDALTEMDIPATVTSVGYQAFYDCDGLTKITIPDSVTTLGDSVFYDCDALTDVKLGTGITTIPASAFRHCDVLEQLTVPRRVTSIGDNAFKDSVKFSSIFIPRSVTAISSSAFSYPDKLTVYGVAGTYAETFANENSIKFVDQQVPAEDVKLDQTELTINKGTSAQLTLTVTPEDFTDAVVWKSSNTDVATVSDTGTVKAVGTGTATIKVTAGGVSASCKVTVLQPVTSISLNRTSLTLEALDTWQLQATVYPSAAADQRVQWSSSAPDVATVDESGLVTANRKGTAVITAAAMDGSGVTRTCTVTVSNTAYICTEPEQMESPHNYPDSCTDVWLYTSPGAQKLYVTFDERTMIEDGFDYLYIYDGNNQLIGKYTGAELAGTTVTVPGSTVKIQMGSDGSGSEWGFKVTAVRTEAGAVVITPVGGENAPVCRMDGQTLTVSCDRSCTAAYQGADGEYIRLTALANADGSYSYTVPEGVRAVTVVVKGDLNGDGKLTAMEARQIMMAVTHSGSLSGQQMLCADLNGDGKVSAIEARQILSAVTNSAAVKW